MEIYLRVRRAHYQDGLSGREIARNGLGAQFGVRDFVIIDPVFLGFSF